MLSRQEGSEEQPCSLFPCRAVAAVPCFGQRVPSDQVKWHTTLPGKSAQSQRALWFSTNKLLAIAALSAKASSMRDLSSLTRAETMPLQWRQEGSQLLAAREVPTFYSLRAVLGSRQIEWKV